MAREVTNVKWAVAFVFVTVLLNSVGFGIILPVLPELIVDVTGDPLHEAARYGGWLAFAYASMQFIFSPLAGNLSDRFGRRPVLLVSLLVFGLDYLIMGLAPTLAWLFLGRLIAGTSATSFGIANACIADLFPPEKRAQNFGLIGAAFGVGFILGPVIGGFLGEFGPRTPFFRHRRHRFRQCTVRLDCDARDIARRRPPAVSTRACQSVGCLPAGRAVSGSRGNAWRVLSLHAGPRLASRRSGRSTPWTATDGDRARSVFRWAPSVSAC